MVVITDTPMQRARRVTSVVVGVVVFGRRMDVSMLASWRAPDECPLNRRLAGRRSGVTLTRLGKVRA
jgi:hypothetical protein